MSWLDDVLGMLDEAHRKKEPTYTPEEAGIPTTVKPAPVSLPPSRPDNQMYADVTPQQASAPDTTSFERSLPAPVEKDYNIWGEERANVEHGFKNRLKQVGRGALYGAVRGLQASGGDLRGAIGGAIGGAGMSAAKPGYAGTLYQRAVVEPRVRGEEQYEFTRKLQDAKLMDESLHQQHEQASIDSLYQKPQKQYQPMVVGGKAGSFDISSGAFNPYPNQEQPETYADEYGLLHDVNTDKVVLNKAGNPQHIAGYMAANKTPQAKPPSEAEINDVGKQIVAGMFNTQQIINDYMKGREGTPKDKLGAFDKNALDNANTPIDVPAHSQAQAVKGGGIAEVQVPPTKRMVTDSERNSALSHLHQNQEAELAGVKAEVLANSAQWEKKAAAHYRSLRAKGMSQEDAISGAQEAIQAEVSAQQKGAGAGGPAKATQSTKPAPAQGTKPNVNVQALYEFGLKKGMTPEQALQEVRKHFPDFNPQ